MSKFDPTDPIQLLDEIIRVGKENPTKVNPVTESSGGYAPRHTCLYDDGEGNRCIFGQVFYENGIFDKIEQYMVTVTGGIQGIGEIISKSYSIDLYDLNHVGLWMTVDLQERADYGGNDGGLATWGEVAEMAEVLKRDLES